MFKIEKKVATITNLNVRIEKHGEERNLAIDSPPPPSGSRRRQRQQLRPATRRYPSFFLKGPLPGTGIPHADGCRLALLGFKPINATGAAKLYDQSQFPDMCRAMIHGLQDAADQFPLAA